MSHSLETPPEPFLVQLPDAASPIQLPKGWTRAEDMDVLTLVGPERDLQVAFVATAKKGETQEIAAAAWHLWNPGLELVVARQVDQPSTGGWDLASEILYRTPTAESRVVFAYFRTLGERAYVNLITGTLAAFSRREAQIAELLQAWRPEGLTAISLADRAVVTWSSPQSDELGRFIREAMATMRIPGVAIAIVQHGSVAFAEGFGFCAAGSTRPVTPDTRFMIGSTTKSLTTLMMARLVQQGHFSWATPVTELLPDFALADSDMTRRLQMQHTVAACTGMPRRDVDLVFKFKGISPEQRLVEMRAMRPTTGFGEIFQYSNYLVAAGGYAAARSFAHDCPLGSAYEQAMQQLVFDPLGMTNSTLHQEVGCTNNAASPHATDFDGNAARIDPVMERFVDAAAPAGAIWSTVLDMAQYLLLELNGGNSRSGESLISTALLEGRRRGGIKIDGKTSYGLGLVCAEEHGLEIIGHGGNTLGFTSDMYFLPAKDLGVVVLTNLRLANTFLAAVRQKILEMLFDARPISDQMIAGAAKALDGATKSIRSRVQIDPDSVAWLDHQVGHYYCDELGDAQITQRDGQYWIQFEAWGSALGSEMQSDGNRLVVLASPPWIGLRLQVAGEGSELRLDGGQTQYVFKKCQSL